MKKVKKLNKIKRLNKRKRVKKTTKRKNARVVGANMKVWIRKTEKLS